MDTMEHSENTTEAVVGETERERRQFAKMTKTPIPKLVVMLGIPTMLNMMVSSLYNLADTYFVSGLGEAATGAVNVVLSLMAIIQAIGFTFGMGGGSIISRLLGKRAQKEADEVSSSAFFAAGRGRRFDPMFRLTVFDPSDVAARLVVGRRSRQCQAVFPLYPAGGAVHVYVFRHEQSAAFAGQGAAFDDRTCDGRRHQRRARSAPNFRL